MTQARADAAAALHAQADEVARGFALEVAAGETKRQQAEADRVQNETIEALEGRHRVEVAGFNAAADRLREQIKRAGSASSATRVPDSSAGATNPGNLLAVVLDRCVARLGELAEIADIRGVKRAGAEDLYNSVRSSEAEGR